jgi:hypothetical protein
MHSTLVFNGWIGVGGLYGKYGSGWVGSGFLPFMFDADPHICSTAPLCIKLVIYQIESSAQISPNFFFKILRCEYKVVSGSNS